ncbi:phosphoribosylformylglycinamidine synthase subunit PurL [Micromonospora fiedleri]|uniref:Phosphoribosylformylglycinamidine synthase subunit PurL n=1 Tax=Micromonospora fiedleri TaxID=1157498 RepID=A0ABS1UKR7_9ACTN|nr:MULTISPECIES: phosphoribosylformylglycinamidine synthase subunit PurL [Micromonospora]MBL6276913.1 phosphoribosylformylglycinamidine synthase subunit PurL [Micromonospora fiedleri]WSK43376.1 phosphoribosylformylglycinamidine synthase subunit PurL [Micromonospora maris]
MTTHPDPVRETPEAVPATPAQPVQPYPAAAPARHASGQADWADRVDTVPRAEGTPEELQPYAELGLRDDEYDRIRHILGRRPTQSELAMYSIMWSEHCSYKSSKVHLRQFGEKAPPSDRLLAGIGENAGVVRVSDELAVTFKVESHNHPSFVEPYQGAATGVGGIVRDILAMGARPVAVMDPLRFGAADHPDTARVLPGVVAGVGGYGNCLGLPNIGGEVVFDPCYQGNPLVNALCLGVLPVSRLQNKAAVGPGNVVVLMGAKTGRDGIGGVSVLASATFTEGSEQRRPSVQVGDPFTEKLLIEACLELYDAELVAGIQDLGGAGLTCALTETAAAAGTGMRVWLERVPLREPSMDPHEILASESQERMLLVVEPAKLEAVLKTCEKWGVLATAIGEVTAPEPDGRPGRLLITWRDQLVVDVPPGSLVDDGPVYARPMREPADLILLQADRAETLPRPSDPDALRETVLRMIASPNLCDKTWVTEQYDRYVLGNTVLAQPEDSGVIRIDERTGLGVALSVDGNGRYARLDPYHGAKLALAEAYRNVVVTGATPIAVTDCLNFGSPEDPGVMWQFAEAVRGLADGCAELGIPVTGGNVSFYNQTGAAAIHPTPVVGVLGVLENVAERVAMGFVPRPSGDHDQLFLLGETHVELSGSEWAWVAHQHLGGVPPHVDLAREKQLGELLAAAARVGHVSSAHDLSDGGLAQSLVESCLRYGVGARIAVPERFEVNSMPFVFLFSESAGRVLVSVPRGHEKAFTALCAEHGVPWELIGVTDSTGGALEVHGQFRIGLDELREAHSATLPALFGGVQPVELTAQDSAVEAAPVDAVEAPVEADPVPSVEDTEPHAEAAVPVSDGVEAPEEDQPVERAAPPVRQQPIEQDTAQEQPSADER